jgi:hypothetical protein
VAKRTRPRLVARSLRVRAPEDEQVQQRECDDGSNQRASARNQAPHTV